MEKKENIQEEVKKENSSKKKEKWIYAGVIVVMIIISVATSNINIASEVTGFMKNIWNGAQELVGNDTDQFEKAADGAHVDITNMDVVYIREAYEVLGNPIDKEQAIAILKEVKTLAYNGKERGVSAGSKEKDALIADVKKQLKEADESQYNRVVRRYGDEEDYWTVLGDSVEDYIIAEKVKEEKREELEGKVDVDVEKELQEYIDELVSYEKFK